MSRIKSNKKISSKTGQIELEVLDLPQELKLKIQDLFLNHSNKGGRPNLLRIIKDAGKDPFKMLLKLIYLRNVEGKSYDELVKYLERKEQIETAKSTIYNTFSKLEKAGIYQKMVDYSIEKVRRKIKYFYITDDNEIKSDIDYVQSWIEKKRNDGVKIKNIVDYLKLQLKAIEFIRKLPHEWTDSDIQKYLNHLYEYYKKILYEKREKARKNNDKYSRYYNLTDHDIENMARNNVYNDVTALRSILKYVGKSDLVERQLGQSRWKRFKQRAIVDYISRDEYEKIAKHLSFVELLYIKLGITTKARPKSVFNLRWSNFKVGRRKWIEVLKIDPNALPETVDVFESKTKGGQVWRDCRLTWAFDDLPEMIALAYKKFRVKDDDRIFPSLGLKFYQIQEELLGKNGKITKLLDRRITAHMLRKTGINWLIASDVPFELIMGKPESAPFGSGHEDASTFMTHYVKFSESKIKSALAKTDFYIKGKKQVFTEIVKPYIERLEKGEDAKQVLIEALATLIFTR